MTADSLVLIVEDDADIRAALADVLIDEGYRVRVASNGAEGLEALGQTPLPSLVLLDLMMPVMNGWQFRSAQLAKPELAGIPVVVISADASADREVDKLAAAEFLQKPVELDVLLKVVARYVRADRG